MNIDASYRTQEIGRDGGREGEPLSSTLLYDPAMAPLLSPRLDALLHNFFKF
jgi:hypothetical protein